LATTSTGWVTDQNAQVHERVEYFPYGAVWRDPRSDVGASPVKGQRFLFTGKELDEETGLYSFGARYYDPVRARWASPDPALATLGGQLTPELLSLYGYAGHSPVTMSDPDGRMPGGMFPAAIAGGQALTAPDVPLPRAGGVGGVGGLAAQAGRAGGGAVRAAHAVAAPSGSFHAAASGHAASGQPATVDRHLGEGVASLRGGGTATAVLSPVAGPTSRLPASQPAHVFWSGGLEHAGKQAADWAKEHGATTLEQTATGQRLTALTGLLGFSEVKRLWTRASEQFAERASGEVHVFLRGTPRETSIWKTIEEPALKRNPKVTRIVEHHLE
jgi:RHS repeat-associated protein